MDEITGRQNSACKPELIKLATAYYVMENLYR